MHSRKNLFCLIYKQREREGRRERQSSFSREKGVQRNAAGLHKGGRFDSCLKRDRARVFQEEKDQHIRRHGILQYTQSGWTAHTSTEAYASSKCTDQQAVTKVRSVTKL